MNPFVTIIIPVYNEEKYISDCLASVINFTYPKDKLEVFVVDGNSTDKTKEIVKEIIKNNTYIKLLDNSNKKVPISMNIAINKAVGEYIIRLDAHAEYPSNYVSELISSAIQFNTDNIGAVCLTDVKVKNKKSLSIKEVLANKFGVGDSMFRIGVDKHIEVDTVPFGCFKKDVFNKYGKYDERLIRNQDIELNKRIKEGGGKILLIPNVSCTYFARENFKNLAKNNYENGKWNLLTVFYTKNIKSLSFRHFVPMFFVLGLLFPVLMSFFYFPFIYLSVFVFVTYILSVGIISAGLVNKNNSYFFLVFSFLTLHFSYGIGSIVGLIKGIFIK